MTFALAPLFVSKFTTTHRAMIILADNQPLTAAGLAALLPQTPLRTAHNKATLLALLTTQPAASVILDYALFDFVGEENLLVFLRRFPEARWLLISADFSRDLLRLFASEDTVSFVSKDATETELREALIALQAGQKYIAAAVHDQLQHQQREAREIPILTRTETEVLRSIAQGKSSREIAEERHSSVHTIITHKKNIFRKLEVSTAYEATRYAVRAGLVDLVEYYI